ncbi:hypothetical protein ZIOFF_000546 [Zingiber officinale]|uniref:Alkaline/neutral invertase n=2 Tax=Zingiber officinale TaxID=94328 RepID=A0A8J5I4M5_ZINOF|nr:hypothetical protein ZIOFF_000546 [Zingiber officinale]
MNSIQNLAVLALAFAFLVASGSGRELSPVELHQAADLQARLAVGMGEAGGLVECWNSLMELRSCTNEIVLFFLNGESYLSLDCCRAIRVITHHCWTSMFTNLGFTVQETDILRGYCDADTVPTTPVQPQPPSATPPIAVAGGEIALLRRAAPAQPSDSSPFDLIYLLDILDPRSFTLLKWKFEGIKAGFTCISQGFSVRMIEEMEGTDEEGLWRVEPLCSVAELDDFEHLSRLLDRPRIKIERKLSFDERSLSELSGNLRLVDEMYSPAAGRSVLDTPASSARDWFEPHGPHPMIAEAWDALRRSIVLFRRQPVGTMAAIEHASEEVLNYDQVFVRDFVPSALAFLMNGEADIVKNFLLKTLLLQSWEKKIDRFKLGEGVLPASFKVNHDPARKSETLIADFGGSAIGRVAPVDSGFWWIILLRAYTKSTGDLSLAETPECQRGMRLILSLCLSEGFDTFPTLLCADGCSMIDRRMGVYGYPIEIQSLFFMALRCALAMLKPDAEGEEFIERIVQRLRALGYHMRSYFWLDFQQLNDIYRYKTEEYSHTAVNKFNVIPDSIPEWIFDFMPSRGGYFVGNVSPARMDFRWFALGNCIAILSSLATPEQSVAIMDLIEGRWEELVGEMPLKISYPALEGHEWRSVTGCDPKNTRWSYHNGGSWPVLLWLLTAACIKTGRPQIARKAIDLAESRLSKDGWPEYYDGKLGRYIGKQARKYQTWSIAGYLVAKMMLEDPSHLGMISLEEEKGKKRVIKRSASWTA